MMKMIAGLLFAALLLLAPAAACAQTPVATDSPAYRRALELAQLINSGDRRAAETYIKENYAPSFMNIPVSAHLNFILDAHDRSRGVEISGIQAQGANEVTVRFRNKLTGDWQAVLVRVEAEAPHRITGIGMRRAEAPAGDAPKVKLSGEQMVKELDAYVQKLSDADVFSGTVLLAKGDQVLFKKAYGVANKDFNVPNKVDTKFNLGSMNKMFTSVAILQLVERGKLSLDDPLAKFVEFPSKEAAEKIRIKHLLTHTSGLGSYFNRKFMESSRARFRTVDEMLELAKDEKLQFEPGTRWAYSNTGMLVLGKVIEKASGENYFDYMRKNIYQPAGMVGSDCYDLDRVNPNLAVGYEKEYGEQGPRFRNNIFEHVIRGGPAGGGYSTVEDLHRFALALTSGKLVGLEYVRELLSAKPELNSPNYGYGFQIDTARAIVGHGGGFPGISSNLDIFRAAGYTAVVLSNYSRGSFPVQEKMRQLVLAGNGRE